jgi:hypothetical protein
VRIVAMTVAARRGTIWCGTNADKRDRFRRGHQLIVDANRPN